MDRPDNPPAFPRTGEGFGNPLYDDPGMSLRDWFAGQAIAGAEAGEAEYSHETIATAAYALADAMLAERARNPFGDQS